MKIITGGEEAVRLLWHPKSIAVVGASGRPGTLPWLPLHLLRRYGFAGRLYPINPNRDEIGGIRCYPDIASVGEPADVAVVVQSADATMAAVRACGEAGVRIVVLPAQGFGERDESGRRAEQELRDLATRSGMRIVGPNTDGVANLANGSLTTIQPLFNEGFTAGEVAVVTQSGASAGSLIARLKQQGIGCRLYASAGNEIDLGLTDYLSVAIQDPGVRIVVSFVEAIRRPDDFVRVAELAAELGKPIVLIKVGRTEQAARRAAAHTGAMAGADRIYDALFRSLGIIRVDELAEVVAVTKFYLTCGIPRSARVGIMSVSGGQAGALADRAALAGATVPAVSPSTQQRLAELLPMGTPLNPCDLTGDVAKRTELAAEVYRALDADEAVDTVVYGRKELTGDAGRRSARLLAEVAAAGTTPLAVYAMDDTVNADEQATYQDARVPVFSSASELFTAVTRLAGLAERHRAVRKTRGTGQQRPTSLPASASGALDETTTKALLREYGIAVPAEGLVKDEQSAVALADEIGYPVVLKVASERIAHKTEIGGVELGLTGPDQVQAAYRRLVERATSALSGEALEGVLVQQQVTDGVEMIVGLVVDAQFGPFVLVGTGGVFTELLNDSVLRPAPVSVDDATEMIDELRGRRLLEGFRGGPKADVAALAATVSNLSRLGADHAAELAECDLNPVLVRPRGMGAVAVDALMVLRDREGS